MSAPLIALAFVLVFMVLGFVGETFIVSTRAICPTRNMNRDLRGEAHYPPRVEYVFMGSGIGPLDPSKCI